jgi:hypothetical protein
MKQISIIEFAKKANDGATIKIENIHECTTNDTFFQMIKTKAYTKSEDELVRCEDWLINSSQLGRSKYRVKAYHSARDRFFTLVYPPSLRDYFNLYLNSQM